MRTLTAFALFAAAASAQIPLPNYSSSFSTSNATRGYYFTAPTTMFVNGLQVPDERNAGAQAVALYKLSAPPPQYSGSISVTPVFFAAVPNTDVIRFAPVIFQKGDVVAVLGGAGAANSVMNNSYGSGNYASRVNGQPINLLRFLMQANIANNKGVGNVSAEGNGSIARVRMFVIGQGAQLPYGKSSGAGSLVVSDPNPPSIGFTGQFQVVPGGTNQGALLLLGTSKISAPTPYGQLLVGLPFLSTAFLPTLPSAGTPVSIALPKDTNLLNANVLFQAAILSGTQLTLTNGMDWTINN